MFRNKPQIYSFLSLTRGSWRNAFFIECTSCPYGNLGCQGHLLTTDTDGTPFLISVQELERASNEKVDKNECAAVITRGAFELLFNRWLVWNITNIKDCSIVQLVRRSE